MKASFVGSRGAMRATSSGVSTRITSPGGSWPMVPIVSGWPAWPIMTICRPRAECRSASMCTFETSGQVAST
jgi:hypothetical protein